MERYFIEQSIDLASEIKKYDYLMLELFEDTTFSLYSNEQLAQKID